MWIVDTKYWVAKKRDGSIESNLFTGDLDSYVIESDSGKVQFCESVLSVMRSHQYTDSAKVSWLQDVLDDLKISHPEYFSAPAEKSQTAEVDDDTKKKNISQKIIDFFSEFHFEPNFRFVNTFAMMTKKSKEDAKEFVSNYFELSDSQFAMSVSEKVKSREFDDICKELKSLSVSKKVNNRLKLYYGSQGTGKTTIAMKEADNNCMVCHSAMLPSDLMEDFKFDDGKAGFNPSALYHAMVEGKKIVLDEINLLPFESLRFLQSVTDGKSEFDYKGEVVHIKDGFQIIGTMNLVVNGSVFSLPEPLIDRAEDLKKFSLTAENLAGALA